MMRPQREQISVTLLTGFLGSGKTTVLRRLLACPGMADTAVLVNELGEVGLDHNLLLGASETTLVLENGCICCSVQDDLIGCLQDLFWKRLHRQIPRFSRVVIETTGLADPAPIIKTLLSDSLVSEHYRLDPIICTADAVFGEDQLKAHRESVVQASLADVILLTKTDIAESQSVERLEAALLKLNPLAALHRTVRGEVSPEIVFGVRDRGHHHDSRRAASENRHEVSITAPGGVVGAGLLYHRRVRTVTIHFSEAWLLVDFERALRATVSQHGDRILRAKGLLAVAGETSPVVVQVVEQMIFPLHQLPAWPHEQARSHLVFITLGVGLDALSAEFSAGRNVCRYQRQSLSV